MTCGICVENTRMFCFRGVEIVFDVSNLGGMLVCIFCGFIVFFFFSTHAFMHFI